MDQSYAIQIQNIVPQICHWIDSIINPNSTGHHQQQQLEANEKLNELIKNEIHKDIDLYLNVALKLIESNCQSSVDSLTEVYVHYGFEIINNLVKYNWYNFRLELKAQLKQASVSWCKLRLFVVQPGNIFPVPWKISVSPLVLNSCSRCIAEIFVREWPNNWPSFLTEITEHGSLVTLYSILNISDYLYELQIPQNTVRRKEIIKSLVEEKVTIIEYLQKCFAICDSQNDSDLQLPIEYKRMIILKSLELLESLLEWYSFSEVLVNQILYLATSSPLSIQDEFSYKIKLHSYRCIQTIIKRPNLGTKELDIVNSIFFDFGSGKFIDCLTSHILNAYFNYRRPIESEQSIFELFILVLDIAVELLCRSITLYNQLDTHRSIKLSIQNNQNVWTGFLHFLLNCLQYNNANFDEILLKFVLLYTKLEPADPSSFEKSQLPENFEKSTLSSPIHPNCDRQLPLQILTLIGRLKIEPKLESLAEEAELAVCFNIDSYESYTFLFNQNRSKYFNVVYQFINLFPTICTEYIVNILRNLFGPMPHETSNFENLPQSTISFSIGSTLCSAIIPKLVYSAELQRILEFYFDKMLQLLKDKSQDSHTSYILSCLSSMSLCYIHFSPNLIQQLIEQIFQFALKKNNDQSQMKNRELQNHAGALFVKLTGSCWWLLLPMFDTMCTYIDNLIATKMISNLQFCTLYEGLLILSNHYPDVECQRRFIVERYFPKIAWLTSYDFGPDGANFFRDIGLSVEPDFSLSNQLPYFSGKFPQFTASLALLTRFLKRINPNRCLEIMWPSLLDYITPVYKFISAFNQLCSYHQLQDNRQSLDSLCHPFYQPYIFVELPNYCLQQICADQPFLLQNDRYKILLKNWEDNNRESVPSAELIGLSMQYRLWLFYSDSINFVGLTLNHLFMCRNLNPSAESTIESYTKQSLCLMYKNLKSIPFVEFFELIKYYFRNLVSYAPHDNESFLRNSGIIELLNDFLPYMFEQLNQRLSTAKNEKVNSIVNSHPSNNSNNNSGKLSLSVHKPYALIASSNDSYKLEIYMDAIINLISNQFVGLLKDIFSQSKSLASWASKSDIVNSQQQENSQEMMCDNDVADQNNPNERLTETVYGNNCVEIAKFSENDLLSAHLLTYNASPLVIVVSNCLLWPINSLRSVSVIVNDYLINSLIKRESIQSVEGFYYLAERIIMSINLTEKSDVETLNRLVLILLKLYENIVLKYSLTELVNQRLSQISNVEVKRWNDFANSCRSPKINSKLKQKLLRSLLDNVTPTSLSSLHSMSAPTVHCLGDQPQSNQPKFANCNATTTTTAKQHTGDSGHDSDTYSLSWLF